MNRRRRIDDFRAFRIDGRQTKLMLFCQLLVNFDVVIVEAFASQRLLYRMEFMSNNRL